MSRLIRTNGPLQELVFWPGVDLSIDSISTHLPVLFFCGFVSLECSSDRLVEKGHLDNDQFRPQCFRLAKASNVITLIFLASINFLKRKLLQSSLYVNLLYVDSIAISWYCRR